MTHYLFADELALIVVSSGKQWKSNIGNTSMDWMKEIENENVLKSFLRARVILDAHRRIAVSISGGSDSDIVLDIVSKMTGGTAKEINYIWFDTGIEYEATKRHLNYLERRYNIVIQRIKAIKPIPLCCKEYGKPFLSKYASGMIERLQHHGFKWEDKPLDVLLNEYPKCQQAVKWWCNANKVSEGFSTTMFNINYYRGLKEFMIVNPPSFKISMNCCTYAKKYVSKHYIKDNGIDLMVVGLRKLEGGIRSGIYKSCFSNNKGETADYYRPVFFYTDEDKRYYDQHFGIVHSDCYTKYGFKRTGCVGCPFNLKFEQDLEKVREFEPKLYMVCNNIFGDSYEYTRAYKAFRNENR